MIFTPKNGKFVAYSVNKDLPADEITPALFSNIILFRALKQHNQASNLITHQMNEFFINQIDMTQPETFALSMMPFNEWHSYIGVIKDVNNS